MTTCRPAGEATRWTDPGNSTWDASATASAGLTSPFYSRTPGGPQNTGISGEASTLAPASSAASLCSTAPRTTSATEWTAAPTPLLRCVRELVPRFYAPSRPAPSRPWLPTPDPRGGVRGSRASPYGPKPMRPIRGLSGAVPGKPIRTAERRFLRFEFETDSKAGPSNTRISCKVRAAVAIADLVSFMRLLSGLLPQTSGYPYLSTVSRNRPCVTRSSVGTSSRSIRTSVPKGHPMRLDW
jgi:hypothetical protein